MGERWQQRAFQFWWFGQAVLNGERAGERVDRLQQRRVRFLAESAFAKEASHLELTSRAFAVGLRPGLFFGRENRGPAFFLRSRQFAASRSTTTISTECGPDWG